METVAAELAESVNDLSSSPQDTQNGGADGTEPKRRSMAVRLDGLSDFRIHPDAISFTSSEPHGSGGKNEVAKATLRRGDGSDEQQVAVKKLRYYDEIDGKKFGNEFVHEVDVMARLSHKNIVKLIGFVEDLEEGKAWIILSWEPNGNVSEFLATGEWEIPERISLIKDTFAGIEYIHSRHPPICHGDLKSLNILVSASYRAIITDFGSARILKDTKDRQKDRGEVPRTTGAPSIAQGTDEQIDDTRITIVSSSNQLNLTGPAWSLRWAAPEVALGEPQNLATDIWAAGWICWEVMTNKVPFHELNSEGAIVLKVVEGHVPLVREDTQLSQIIRLCSLMTDCWAFDPRNRPNIAQCQSEVKGMPSLPPSKGNLSDSASNTSSTELLVQMARIHYQQGSYKNAISLFQQALSTAPSVGDEATTADILRRLGLAYTAMLNRDQAEQYFIQAQDIYTRIGDDVGQAYTLTWLADLHCNRSNFTMAVELYSQAQSIFSRGKHDHGLASALYGLGSVHYARSEYPEALESYKQARDIFVRLGESRGQGNAIRRLGGVYLALSDHVKAEESYTEAQAIYSRVGDQHGLAQVSESIGELYQHRSKYAEAEESYTRAQEISTRLGKDAGGPALQCKLGHLYRVQGLNTKAAPFFAEAMRLYSQIGDQESEKKSSHWLDVVSRQGDSTTSPSAHGNASVLSLSDQQ